MLSTDGREICPICNSLDSVEVNGLRKCLSCSTRGTPTIFLPTLAGSADRNVQKSVTDNFIPKQPRRVRKVTGARSSNRRTQKGA